MKKIYVNTNQPYTIYFSKNININEDFPNKRLFVITDNNVYSLYKDYINTWTQNIFVIPPGEESKSFFQYQHLCNSLLNAFIQRNDLIVAFGGGVIGDLSGFVASTILRGVDYIQIPTTLLAMVDSSVGGKVAINTEYGKNLIGAFYQPKKVYINPDFLKTLPKKVFSDGMGEVIKYSLISNLDLNDTIENIILNSCQIKAKIVEADEKEQGCRKILNFGHTIGHAIEQYYNYTKYTHGEAVAISMYLMAYISEELGFSKNIKDYVKDILVKNNLPFEMPKIPKETLINLISKDKKSQGEYIDCILLEEIGKPFIKKLTPTEIVDLLFI